MTGIRVSAATGQLFGIDWGAFVLVFGVAFAAAVGIVALYAFGLRLLAVGSRDDTGTDGHIVVATHGDRPVAATIGGFACIGVAALGVLYALYLVIPQFH
jgi:hypothetical protein